MLSYADNHVWWFDLKRMLIIFFLLTSALVCAAAAPHTQPVRPRGHRDGDYSLTVAGQFSGKGSASVTPGTLSLNSNIIFKGAATGTLTATNLTIDKCYFTGAGTIAGVACTIEGRIDLPAATDADQTDKQSCTGRISGTFKDAKGNIGKFMAVQSNPSPVPGYGNGHGGGGGNGNGNNN